jgi:hypothetical protein
MPGYSGLQSSRLSVHERPDLSSERIQMHDAGVIKIYLIDDQAMIRAAFRSLLSAKPRFEVIGDNSDAR